jgi:divalent metal cation (Fe/Co/Zn/Cd) transporter
LLHSSRQCCNVMISLISRQSRHPWAERRAGAGQEKVKVNECNRLISSAIMRTVEPASFTIQFPEHLSPEKRQYCFILACVSLLVMPVLSRAKKRVGAELGSRAMEADAKQTDFCVYLSLILLLGLILNATLGWWWADPISALIMVPIIAKEGIESLKGKTCCDAGTCCE